MTQNESFLSPRLLDIYKIGLIQKEKKMTLKVIKLRVISLGLTEER